MINLNPSYFSRRKPKEIYSFVVNTDPKEAEPEAEAPVPDRLLPKGRNLELLLRLRLSQKIGLLLFLNREGIISEGGKERLLYLQSKTSFEAIEAGLRFAQRLTLEVKLQSDFKHQLIELNRRPQSRRFRKTESRRIGVGYRDKGTLPEDSSSPRASANSSGIVFFGDLRTEVGDLVKLLVPDSIEGEWLDLELLSQGLRSLDEGVSELHTLLDLL